MTVTFAGTRRSSRVRVTAFKEALKIPYFKLLGYRPHAVSAETWDDEYRAGLWDYLGHLDQLAGQLTVFGYCQHLAANSILDVGCGAGRLAEKLKVLSYASYLGVDISAEAISNADRVLGDARTKFAVADAEKFVPGALFDVIVFNQCLYYMPDPLGMVGRYAAFLPSSGRMIVSMSNSARSRKVWSLLENHVAIEDSITVVQAGGRTTTRLLRPSVS